MTKTLVDSLSETPEDRRLLQRYRTVLEMTELICATMDMEGVTRQELAKRLDCDGRYVGCLLDGTVVLSVRLLSDVFMALGRTLHFRVERIDEPE